MSAEDFREEEEVNSKAVSYEEEGWGRWG